MIGWALTEAADRWPGREAIIFEGERVTYRELWRWTTVTAQALLAGGVEPRQHLLWQLPNCLEAVVLQLAAWRIGVVCVPVVAVYREHELRHILGQVQPSAVAFAAERGGLRPAEEMDAVMSELGIKPRLKFVVGSSEDGWSHVPPRPALVDDVSDDVLPDPAPPDECCLILYTSGTTSAPKGVMHTPRTLQAETSSWLEVYGFSSRDTFLMGAPIAHIAGLLTAVIVPLSCGARSVMLPNWDPDQAVALVERERAVFCCGAPLFLRDLVERYERGAAPDWRLRLYMCAGAPRELMERADAVGVKAFRAWGMTEVPTVTLASPEDPLEFRVTRDGRASPGTDIQAVDEDRRPLGAGHAGELRVRAPEQMLGYTDAVIQRVQVDDDGWFYTGDLGYVDHDGWVTITGRIKDIIDRGGEKFSARDVEDVLGRHPAVRTIAVTGVPDPKFGERVAAFVTLNEEWNWPGRQQLLDLLESEKLAKQKFPVAWRVLEELPSTPTGKIQKHKLLEMWNGQLQFEPEPS